MGFGEDQRGVRRGAPTRGRGWNRQRRLHLQLPAQAGELRDIPVHT